MDYNFAQIEKKWQNYWLEHKTGAAVTGSEKEIFTFFLIRKFRKKESTGSIMRKANAIIPAPEFPKNAHKKIVAARSSHVKNDFH